MLDCLFKKSISHLNLGKIRSSHWFCDDERGNTDEESNDKSIGNGDSEDSVYVK